MLYSFYAWHKRDDVSSYTNYYYYTCTTTQRDPTTSPFSSFLLAFVGPLRSYISFDGFKCVTLYDCYFRSSDL